MFLKKVYTLVFLRNETQILLGLKKRGFGVNKWNGFGGKVEQNETIIDAAIRELKEECCVVVNKCDLKNIGHLEFTFEGDSLLMDVRVFSASNYQGVPVETEEMAPKWYGYDEVPFDNMWPDDRIWFPYMVKNKLFFGKFHYKGFDTILNYELQELKSMETFYKNKK
ncbi:oxidized purine nucleoside triphosphate hydrolase-like [Vanessa tameamea]|uniref:Oxidized purine nucleoside triphosphate hydrolase n=1 Tax=Vanessa tameamea TaxID=334116 RepID=A0A8B8ILI4_VANTA|nr:7,8-dihydro-8-oxoguanine triphosphatase-like [Vanessa tameamea]